MTGTPPEEREPRDDTAVLPLPATPTGPQGSLHEPVGPPPYSGLVPLPPAQQTPPPGWTPAPHLPPQPHPSYGVSTTYGAPVHRRPAVGGGHVAVAWVVAVLSLGYMLPWAVAATRGRPNTLAIALVNLLVGWTLIGWVAALVMACLSDPVQVASPTFVQVNPPASQVPPPGWYPDGRGGSRYWDGRGWLPGPR